MSRPGNHVLVIFGATGDLAHRKLLPGLFHLAAAGLMPDRYQIIGVSPQDMTSEQFRDLARQAITEFGKVKPSGAAWQAFQRRISFAGADPARTLSLVEAVTAAERQVGGTPGRLLDAPPPVQPYDPGSWGPQPALDRLTAPYHWHLPSAGTPSPNAPPPVPITDGIHHDDQA